MRVFSETQRFNQWWVQLINLAMLAFLLFSCYNWYIADKSVGNVSVTDTTGQIFLIVSIVLVLSLLYSFRLKTSINEIGIHYQFLPFHFSKKTMRWNEIENCYVRTYSPIKEYGGWGYRTSRGKKGNAFNVRGNKGIQLEPKTGKKLLIGTQKEDEATQVINRYIKKQL